MTRRPADVVVITGASAGVGRDAAVAFARRGAHVGLIARGHGRLEAARREVAAGGRAVVARADVAAADQVEAAAVEVERAFGPAAGDRLLARNGYDAQQTDEPDDPTRRPDNLWEPAPGEHGAHGRFDARSRSVSPAFWAVRHRGALAGAAALGAILAALPRVRRIAGGLTASRSAPEQAPDGRRA
jgi:NAD(P)-dependent dehydrogenase (short-subunit alcohol dehydrogenase family)